MSDVPLTLEELKIEFGKSILLEGLEEYNVEGTPVHNMVIVAPNYHHINAAEKWREANPAEARSIGAIANHALGELPGGIDNTLMSIISDHMKDLYGIQGILDAKAPYFQTILANLAKHSMKDIEQCLKAIVAFGNGE